MRYFTLPFALLFVILGCTTANKNAAPSGENLQPPDIASWPINDQLFSDKDFDSIDIFLNRAAKENPDERTSWWVDYRRAQLWSQKDKNVACESFSRLAASPLFPLKPLAYLRAHAICPKNNQILSRLDTFKLEPFDPWLGELAIDVALQKAHEKKDQTQLSELYLKKSKMNLRKEEKIAYAELALKHALKNNDEKKASELRARIFNLSPSRKPNATYKDYLAVANDYRFRREFTKAMEYYNKVVAHKKTTPTEKIYALRGIRTSYKIQQQRPAAVAATEELAKFVSNLYKKSKKTSSDAKLLLDTQLLLTRTYWTEERASDAVKTLILTEKMIGKKTSLAELYWIRGRMAEEKSDFAKSIDWFRKALDETIETESFRNKVKWYLAWNLRKEKKYPEAIDILKELAAGSEINFEKYRLRFWLAKTLSESGKENQAEDVFKQIIKEDPLNYYGLISHRELNLALPTKAFRRAELEKMKLNRIDNSELKNHVDENYLSWLIATKENAIANSYLDSVAESLRKKKNIDQATWVSLLKLYASAESYLSLFNQLQTLDSELRRDIIEKHPEVIFPNPYFDTVSQSANRFGLSVEFIYSIMRQESSFNPQARSQMDAFGLMQLLPEVAKRSADANDITFNKTEDLYEPHINIPIGSAHLRELWDKYNGELVLAVASYNASENAILSWLKTRYRGDTLEFIEDIPYDETRDYVKLVMRNLVTYKILNSAEEKLVFPEWTLRISYQDSRTNSPDQYND